MVKTGLDLLPELQATLKGAKIGVLCNQASLNTNLVHIVYELERLFPGQLKIIFSPQHGFSGQDQDNMVETPHFVHPRLNVPIYSLYSDTRAPSPEVLGSLDVLLVDLQDVGTRVYTFSSTVLYCLKVASRTGTEVIVLDRPNPLGGNRVMGNVLGEDMFSFVGNLPVPMVHGMTLGELALAQRSYYKLDCHLRVLTMKGWQRWMNWEDTGLRWHMPSPNMPWYLTSYCYPATVLLEGTNVSEGRGTTRPFEIFGAPFLDPYVILENIPEVVREGVILQEYVFKPTFNKWANQLNKGLLIHVVNQRRFNPYLFGLELLRLCLCYFKEYFQWKPPPYEYEYQKMPIDIITGSPNIRLALENGIDATELSRHWDKEINCFLAWRSDFLLYQ